MVIPDGSPKTQSHRPLQSLPVERLLKVSLLILTFSLAYGTIDDWKSPITLDFPRTPASTYALSGSGVTSDDVGTPWSVVIFCPDVDSLIHVGCY